MQFIFGECEFHPFELRIISLRLDLLLKYSLFAASDSQMRRNKKYSQTTRQIQYCKELGRSDPTSEFERKKGERTQGHGHDPGRQRTRERKPHGLKKLEAKARECKERKGMGYHCLFGRGQAEGV